MLHNIQPTFWKSDKIIDSESNTVKLLLTNLREIFLIATPNVKMFWQSDGRLYLKSHCVLVGNDFIDDLCEITHSLILFITKPK